MEQYKSVKKKWIEVNDLSSGQCSVSKNVRFKTSMLRSDLCVYIDEHIVVKGRITFEGDNDKKKRKKKLIFKNNAPFRSYISKTNNTFVNNTENLDIVMPLHNLLEYSDHYSVTSGSLWNFYRDEINDDENENDNANNRINKNKIITSKSLRPKY